jgi:preprotein translocase subunit SecB
MRDNMHDPDGTLLGKSAEIGVRIPAPAALFDPLPCVSQTADLSASKPEPRMSVTNGGPAPQAGMPQMPVPQIGILSQYVKDFSFENPNAPNSFTPSTEPPRIGINIAVEATPLAETDVEVTLRLDGKAESQSMVLFGFELLYAGLFRVLNVPPESMQPTVLIECPRLLFPFAREIIATATRNGGFPPLLLEPVDFTLLYRQRMAGQAATAPPAFNPS